MWGLKSQGKEVGFSKRGGRLLEGFDQGELDLFYLFKRVNSALGKYNGNGGNGNVNSETYKEQKKLLL